MSCAGALGARCVSLVSVMGLVLAAAPSAETARILGIFPTPSISHQLPYQAVMKALAARGHQVTVISTDPLKEPIANYTDVDLSFSYKYPMPNYAAMSHVDPITSIKIMAPIVINIIDIQLSSQQVQNFLRQNASDGFDLVLMEWYGFQPYFGIVHAVGSPPIIGIMSTPGVALSYYSIGNPFNPAINPEPFNEYTDHMTFWQRLYNTYFTIRTIVFWEFTYLPTVEAQLRKYFGEGLPPVRDTIHNASLLLMNNHWSTEYPRALLPNVVPLTGLHVSTAPRPLPPDLQAWLDGAGTAGVVYFSLGSNVMSKDLPPAKRDALLRAFARLPQRVLWKWEADELPGRPPNVRVAKWLPQQDILAHPNVRLFITQGGLQSFQEATYHAVPLLGIPFVGDQSFNVAKIVHAGVGRRLDFKDLTEESLYTAVVDILVNPVYEERMRRFSSVFREHKERSLDAALWWVEYVLRHEGAPHLRAASLRLAWYQLLLLDVAAFVAAAAALALLLLYFLLRTARRLLLPDSKSADSKASCPIKGKGKAIDLLNNGNAVLHSNGSAEIRQRKYQ